MDRRTFITVLSLLLFTFAVTTAVRYYRPDATEATTLSQLPLQFDGWVGRSQSISESVLELLNPVDYFNGDYVSDRGVEVNIFVDYFSSAKGGGPHSPRNCMPGSGWIIENTISRTIEFEGQIIDCHRLTLTLAQRNKVMDFWYVTRYGATANDYLFKFYSMLSALSFRSTDVAFVRFITDDDEASIAAMEDFQQKILPEVFKRLPF